MPLTIDSNRTHVVIETIARGMLARLAHDLHIDLRFAGSLDALRALCGAHWAAGGGEIHVTSDGDAAGRALADLGLGTNRTGSATV